jgi:methylated-DNA-[protein]-cysteine S-methyltransferase
VLITSIFNTPCGNLEVVHDEHFIFNALFTQKTELSASNPLNKLIRAELSAYFTNPHHHFQLPLKPQVSTYQQHVLNALLVIPVGRTLTYGELALKLQSSPRAIGQACKRNPLALFIPCHRVVGKTNIGGFMGNPDAIHYKKALLAHESLSG